MFKCYICLIWNSSIWNNLAADRRHILKNQKDADLSPSRRVLGMIREIQGNIRCRFMSKAQDMGFSMPQFLVMYELSSSGDMTMHDLIERLKLPKSTVSRIVEQLVEKKMLDRTRLRDNRRVVMLKATPRYIKGKLAMKNLVVGAIDRVLSPAKAKQIISSLEELKKALELI